MTYQISKTPKKHLIDGVNKYNSKLLENFIPIPKFLYTFIGFTPYSEESKFVQFVFWFNYLNNCAAVIGQIIFLKNIIEANADFIDSTALVGCICFGSDNNVKLLMTIWRKKKVLKNILKELLKLHPNTEEKQKKYELNHDEKFGSILAKRIYYFLLISHYLSFSFFSLFPFAFSAFNYYKEDKFLYRTPLFIWYPFDITKTFWLYGLIYIHQGFCVVMTTVTTFGYALTFSNIILQIAKHFDFIATEFKQMSYETRIIEESSDKDYELLRELLIMHQAVFRLCDLINDAFGFGLFYYILNVSISICCLGIQIAGGASIFIILNYFGFFLYQVVQLFVFCTLGEKIIQVSENISEAVFSEKWIYKGILHKKAVLILLNRAQKPSKIKGGGFFVLSFETFRKVMSFSYQVFALLLKMLKN